MATETHNMKCPISGASMEYSFSNILLNKYTVDYFYCKESGLLQTEVPYWLTEAYSAAINLTDTGLVNRNIINAKMLEVMIERLTLSEGKLLDIAGGYGLLTRLLRDKGFDCYTTDKYCENLFAKTFEPDVEFKADVLFAFEVLEHIVNPLGFLEDNFLKFKCNTIILSTQTFNESIPSKNWWYFASEGGQHITFYQPRTLALLATKLGCQYYQVSSNIHIISNTSITKFDLLIFSNRYLNRLYAAYVEKKRRGQSKTWSDHQMMVSLQRTSE